MQGIREVEGERNGVRGERKGTIPRGMYNKIHEAKALHAHRRVSGSARAPTSAIAKRKIEAAHLSMRESGRKERASERE